MNAALLEAQTYHDPQRRGYFALLHDGQQTSYRLSELPQVLDALPAAGDVFLSQQSFRRPNRRLVNLERLGVCFADLDIFKTGYAHLTPDQQAIALRLHCEDVGLPRPSLINFSGRGLHPKWLFDTPVPAEALPRWNAVERALGEALVPFGADRAARDGSRCLRAVGSVNPRSGQTVHTIWQNNFAPIGANHADGIARYDFDLLAYEVLPFARETVKARRLAPIGAKPRGTAPRYNLWTVRQLWWNRLADLRCLVVLRGWQKGVPEGYRNNFLFIAACAVMWGAEAAQVEAEVETLARELTPTLSPSQVRACVTTALSRARAGLPYRFTNLRLIEMLDIQPDEQALLKTIYDPDERKRRDRERHRKTSDRATYEAQARQKREKAQSLRVLGLSYAAISEQMGLTLNATISLLRTP